MWWVAWSWFLSSLTHSEPNDYVTVYHLVSYILVKHYILITLLPDHIPSLPLHCLQKKPLPMVPVEIQTHLIFGVFQSLHWFPLFTRTPKIFVECLLVLNSIQGNVDTAGKKTKQKSLPYWWGAGDNRRLIFCLEFGITISFPRQNTDIRWKRS